MTSTYALVPIRGLPTGKSRLAGLFARDQRRLLTGALGAHVVGTLAASEKFDEILVLSQELTELFPVLSAYPDTVVLEQPEHITGLNGALDLGRTWARMRGADRIAVVSADLPLLHVDDVTALLSSDASVTVARDDMEIGTNALVLDSTRDPFVIDRFRFGFEGESLAAHAEEARRIGADARIVTTRGLSLDLDTPDDWQTLSPGLQSRLLTWRIPDPFVLAGVP